MNCPICKEEPQITSFIGNALKFKFPNRGRESFHIFCPNCDSMYTEWHETEEEAWEEWEQLCEEPNK